MHITNRIVTVVNTPAITSIKIIAILVGSITAKKRAVIQLAIDDDTIDNSLANL